MADKRSAYSEALQAMIVSAKIEQCLAEGNLFVVNDVLTIAGAGGVKNYLLTPGAAVTSLASWVMDTDSTDVLIELFESPTGALGGAAISAVSLNRVSVRAALFAVTEDPVLATDGVRLGGQAFYGTQQNRVAGVTLASAWIFDPTKVYLIRVTNNDTGIKFSLTLGIVEEPVT